MSKTFTPRPGDKWTKHGENVLWLYRGDTCWTFNKDGHGLSESGAPAEARYKNETDLPTPDAHAQLREWGYKVTGDEKTSRPTILPYGWYSETLCTSNWAGPAFDPPLTEARVREIVAQMLAAQPIPAEVREAAKVASDPKTEWVELDDWQKKCKVWQPTPGDMWAVHSPSRKCHLVLDDPLIGTGWYVSGEGYGIGRNFKTEADARAALAKAPPPPDVSPEPDWRGLLAELGDVCDTIAREQPLGDFKNHPALSSARTNLTAKGTK